jgi:hypothetical protein
MIEKAPKVKLVRQHEGLEKSHRLFGECPFDIGCVEKRRKHFGCIHARFWKGNEPNDFDSLKSESRASGNTKYPDTSDFEEV